MGSGGGDGCFRKGTLVQQEHGKQIAIELLKQGDEVLSFDEQGNIHVSRVTTVHYHENLEPLIRIRFWNGSIDITPNHWVLNQYASFAEAGKLKENDAFIDGLGHLRPIISIEMLEPEPVWNLTVEPNHTFIANGIRVHNGGYRNRYPVAGSGGGGGGKGGGGAQHTPTEAPDNLFSKQFARVVDLISEGEIEGLVDGYKSIYLDGTPVQSADGTMNFSGITFDSRNGTQSQSYMPGFGTVEAEFPVSSEVKYGVPVPRSISSNPNINAVRVTIGIPSLTYQNPTTGDLSGTSVDISIELDTDGGGYVTVVTDNISGKTTSLYQRNYRIELTGIGPWTLRVNRLTADSTQANIRNETWWSSYTELSDSKLRYPNSAVFASSIDSSQFKSVPVRGYDIKGVKVQIPPPSVYDPINRTYTGAVWEGDFVTAWTDNPAWCFYDIITNDRYGVGAFISADQVDIWALYTIAQYCDQLVNDGFGGTEPRFTCNLYIQTREEAYKVINAMASIFRGLVYWAGGSIIPVQDAPSSPVALFTPANVIDGTFSYEGTSIRARHTVVLVSWNDPSDQYRQKIEYVEDPEGIERFGVVQSEIVAFGCTSRGQAHRIGKWLLYSERLESEVISFKSGLESLAVNPGDIIKTSDPIRAGERRGGRVTTATTTSIGIDSAIDIVAGTAYVLWCVLPDGTVETRSVINGVGSVTTIVVSTPFTYPPQPQSMWVLASTGSVNLIPETWRIISITEVDKVQAQITALAYREDKYDAVETDLILEPLSTTNINIIPSAPTTSAAYPGLPAGNIQDVMYFNGASVATKIIVSWQPNNNAYSYLIRYRKQDENWIELPHITGVSVDVPNVVDGALYTFRIWSISAVGKLSPDYLELTHTVIGKEALPSNVSTLSYQILKNGINLSWPEISDVDRSDYGICLGDTWTNPITWIAGTSLYLPPCASGAYTYQIRSRDTTDNLSSGSIIQISKGSPAVVTLSAHGYITDEIIRLDTSTTLPTGLATGVDYYVEYIDANTFNLKLSSGGALINTTDFGVGTHYVIRNILTTFTISTPATVDPTAVIASLNNSSNLVLTWEEPTADFQIKYYSIYYGSTFETATFVGTVNAKTFSLPAKWVGVRRWWVTATDIADNTGSAGFEDVNVDIPVITSFTSQVIDNNVLLYWSATPGTLLIDTYELRRGTVSDTWDTADLVGQKSGGFTSVFETTAGDYKYFIAAIDTAGNTSASLPPSMLTASVSQPPDYILKDNYYSDFSGTKTNMFSTNSGSYITPINTTETYEEHFTVGHTWASPDDQVTAGYPIYIQPNSSSGSYVETIDYIALIPSSKINIALNSSTVAGSVTTACTIETSPDNATWTTFTDTWSCYTSNFRYVRFTITFTASGLTDLLEVSAINIRLDSKLKTITTTHDCTVDSSGTYSQTGTALTVTATGTWTAGVLVDLDFTSGTAVDGIYEITTGGSGSFIVTAASATTSGNCTVDATGNPLYLTDDGTSTGTLIFLDVDNIQVTPAGTTAAIGIYNFVDVPNPLSYKVLLFNTAGARIAGTVSITVRGF